MDIEYPPSMADIVSAADIRSNNIGRGGYRQQP
jgi:hypothetical protein